MKQFRPAFTIIEILISVIIISLAIIPVLKIHTENHKQIVYISERNKRALQDSLYLSENMRVTPVQEQEGPAAIVNEVMLKGKHSSNYFHFKLEGF